MIRRPPESPLFPYAPLFGSQVYAGRDPLTGRKRYVSRQVPGTGRAAMKQAKQVEVELLADVRSEEHTSELQSRQYLVCSLLLEKKTEKSFTFQILSSPLEQL